MIITGPPPECMKCAIEKHCAGCELVSFPVGHWDDETVTSRLQRVVEYWLFMNTDKNDEDFD